jgi:tetratricopeptide (TPR) repeat protein
MPSERIQRQIDALLDEADAAMRADDWATVGQRAQAALRLDPANEDARGYMQAAARADEATDARADVVAPATSDSAPASFAGGRYVAQRFLGEGGKKRVYLAHDELLDRDVAFALIKTEGLDEVGRERVVREAQAMGRMGTHPHIVSIFDFGEYEGAPYVVTELMGGGDVEGLLDDADGPLPLAQALEIAKATARGLVFAHDQGVVHRDLKPGNVWLTSDGVAKIGDFGLAVAEGRSRLTQHGMMVGTFGYMPPEQALGQQVTPQADLYSLGAMLYELVTGQPPFVGDDATAVISQHINTAPVRPSLRSDHCPPDLESLVLRLLAKAPDDRPASAAEVLEALDAVDPDARSASDSHANPLDRLARGVFVGREAELERLRTAADEAFAGRGSVVMLVGEPGIGKTRTAQELETYARMRGAQVLWGRAHEASGAPAYWPWVQVGRGWGRANDVRALAEVLQGAGSELVRLFPELPGILGQEPRELPPVADESAQFRLFDAYASFLRAASEGAPLVIVLDDIHWAEKPTLLLLQHLSREMRNAQLLLVGTYRDTELARAHPLSEALAELNREGGFERIVLRGLAESETRAYLAATIGREPRADLVSRIHEETEGNPFFLSEVVNLLTEEGTLDDSVSDIALPDGVREALGRRLDRLSAEANELLATASVVGREFEYETLALLGDSSDDDLLELIEEGLAARVIEELGRPGRFRFGHALMQETLLAELSTTRVVRLHGRVAEALERQHHDRINDRAAELAMHFVASAELNREHSTKARHYSQLAGQQAEAQFAWAEAVRHYEHALTLSEGPGAQPGTESATLTLALGRCSLTLNDMREAWRAFRRAIDLYGVEGDAAGVAEATLAAIPLALPHQVPALRAAALEHLGDEQPHLKARLLVPYAGAGGVADTWSAEADRDTEHAAELARQWGYRDVEAAILDREAHRAIVECRLEDAADLANKASEAYEAIGSYLDAAHLNSDLVGVLVLAGHLERGAEAVLRALDYARPRRLHRWEHSPVALRAELGLMRGDATALREAATGSSSNYWLVKAVVASELEARGDPTAAVRAMPRVDEIDAISRTMGLGLAARLHMNAGDEATARESLHDWAEGLRHGLQYMLLQVHAVATVDECLPRLGDDSLVQFVYQRLTADWRACKASSGRSFDRQRGSLALRLDLVEEAERHFGAGLEWCEREGCPVEAGRNLEGLAEVAERRGGREQAMEYLDRAGELFSRHGTKLYLDQVLAKKEILKA